MASKRRARWASCAVLVPSLFLLYPRSLFAEASASQKETARSLMAEGRALREQKDLTGALSRFLAADSIMSVPTTGYELARAQADVGLLVEARSTVRRVLTQPAKDDDPPPFEEARSKCETLDAELEARIASLRFIVNGLAKGEVASVTVDGTVIAPAATVLPFRVNPGPHHIVVKAGSVSAVRDVTVAERDALDVVLELSPNPARPEPRPTSGPAQPNTGGPPLVSYVAGGVAVTGLVVGGITGLLAVSKKHSAEAGCHSGQCPPSTWSDLDSAHSMATVSTIGFIVAAVSVGVGIGGWVLAPQDSPPPAVQARISVSRGVSSLSLAGRF